MPFSIVHHKTDTAFELWPSERERWSKLGSPISLVERRPKICFVDTTATLASFTETIARL